MGQNRGKVILHGGKKQLAKCLILAARDDKNIREVLLAVCTELTSNNE